jgi:hypothetical protein
VAYVCRRQKDPELPDDASTRRSGALGIAAANRGFRMPTARVGTRVRRALPGARYVPEVGWPASELSAADKLTNWEANGVHDVLCRSAHVAFLATADIWAPAHRNRDGTRLASQSPTAA